MINPPYLRQLMRVATRKGTRYESSAREALAEALTDHNRRVLSAGATRVP